MNNRHNHIDINFDFYSTNLLDILLNLDEGVIITDASGRIRFYNKAQATIDQLDPAKAINRLVTEVYGLSKSNSLIFNCLQIGEPIINQLFYYRLNESDKICKSIHTVFPLYTNGSGSTIGTICFIRNVDMLEKTVVTSSTSAPDQSSKALKNGTRFTFSDMIGVHPSILTCLRRARNAALSKSPIMICGETGTGKELLVQAIHNYSQRHANPFVAINCAAIPESLQESTLFGTSRGAFTGSLEKKGLFEEAQGGTLYLDECDSMPLSLQAKLLRVLEEMKLRRVGSNKETSVDVRILSSIKKDYYKPLPKQSIRKDLYYRLSVVFIEIPPLRERKQDLEILSHHFIHKHNLVMETNVESVSPEVLELFQNYDWPGNVRELEHVIEGSMNCLGEETVINFDHLPDNFALDSHLDTGKRNKNLYTFFPIGDQDKLLQGLKKLNSSKTDPQFYGKTNLTRAHNRDEAELILKALKTTRGNISQAASQLGVSRQLLHYKLKKFGIKPKEFKIKRLRSKE